MICSCIVSLLYTTYLFMAYEESGIHQAQENENRFWTIFALLFSTALFFAQDSPFAFGRWSPSLGFMAVVLSGYVMHLWDRYVHRVSISRYVVHFVSACYHFLRQVVHRHLWSSLVIHTYDLFQANKSSKIIYRQFFPCSSKGSWDIGGRPFSQNQCLPSGH